MATVHSLETGPENVVTLKVVGIGGAGGNVVNRMVSSGTNGVEFIAVNTDKQALAMSTADQKIQIGEKLTHGQGAGSDPTVGEKAAEESRNEIAKCLEGTDMLFITAGMGGGTGTGAGPVVADIAREAGILTVGVVTKPFGFEGKKRMTQAMGGIDELLGRVDSLLVIPNDRLKYATDQKVTFANAFEIADEVLHEAVTSISGLIKNTGFINLDFADVCTIMRGAGFAHMGVGHAVGKGKAEDAAQMAISSPLMETSINGARGVLINITGSEDMGLEDVETAANLVQAAAHPEANIIFGASFDNSMEDEIRVIVIATGFDEDSQTARAVATNGAPAAAPVEDRKENLFSQTNEMASETKKAPEPDPEEEEPSYTLFKIYNTKKFLPINNKTVRPCGLAVIFRGA
ncbi:MAG: cell division protein FtsZ [Oscillospiraceae bacterium]|nr:cell division protein FtsZ [Oscillospiraceae bacterium]